MVTVMARTMRCYLINEDVEELEEVLQPRYRPNGDQGFVVLATYGNAPYGTTAFLERFEPAGAWAESLGAAIPGALLAFARRTPQLVIMLPVHIRRPGVDSYARPRYFAVRVGRAHGILNWNNIDTSFALRAAAVMQGLEPSRETDLLEGDRIRRLLRDINDDGVQFGSGLTAQGGSIRVSSSVTLLDLQAELEGILAASSGEERVRTADWLRPLDPGSSNANNLQRALTDRLLSPNLEPDQEDAREDIKIELSPPDDDRRGEIEAIRVTNEGNQRILPEVSVETLSAALRRVEASPRTLWNRVEVAARIDGVWGESSPLRSWLTADVATARSVNLFAFGSWYEGEEPFIKKLHADLEAVQDLTATLGLESWPPDYSETQYNSWVANGDPSLLNLDRKLVKASEDKFEACDLLHIDGPLVHVKHYKDATSSLSHLFVQAGGSTELLKLDFVAKSNFVHLVHVSDQQFVSTAMDAPEVVTYAIAVKDTLNLPRDLPLLAKVSLRDSVRRIRSLGVTPSVARIQIV